MQSVIRGGLGRPSETGVQVASLCKATQNSTVWSLLGHLLEDTKVSNLEQLLTELQCVTPMAIASERILTETAKLLFLGIAPFYILIS